MVLADLSLTPAGAVWGDVVVLAPNTTTTTTTSTGSTTYVDPVPNG